MECTPVCKYGMYHGIYPGMQYRMMPPMIPPAPPIYRQHGFGVYPRRTEGSFHWRSTVSGPDYTMPLEIIQEYSLGLTNHPFKVDLINHLCKAAQLEQCLHHLLWEVITLHLLGRIILPEQTQI